MTDVRQQRSKLPPDTKVPCFICKTQEPLLTAHDHHRKPRAFGGTDDKHNRVWLCASCHTRLHRVQEFVVQGKTASAYDLCSAIFQANASARAQLWTLANEAAVAENEVQSAFDLHRSSVQVNLTIDTEVWSIVKALAKERNTSAKKLAAELLKTATEKLG